MLSKVLRSLFVLAVAAYVTIPLGAQPSADAPDMPIDSAVRTAVIENLMRELTDGYVFPDVAAKMVSDLRTRASKNEYDQTDTARSFADKLTADLQSVSKDKHLRVRFSADVIPVRKEKAEPTSAEKAEYAQYIRVNNASFKIVEHLPGNIGYIKLNGFSDAEFGADVVAAAMNFVANTDALIFDLRDNGGGSPEMVALISSYLFGDKPVHLNSLYSRKANATEDFWTKPSVAGKKYGNKDVYILTAKRTFSAAEEFTYNLKNLKRAVVVGETTGGGAHPGGVVRLSDHFQVFVPDGRAINPITKTNWEGTGVEPDIKTPKELALKTAYLLALNRSAEAQKDERIREALKKLAEKTSKELDELKKIAAK